VRRRAVGGEGVPDKVEISHLEALTPEPASEAVGQDHLDAVIRELLDRSCGDGTTIHMRERKEPCIPVCENADAVGRNMDEVLILDAFGPITIERRGRRAIADERHSDAAEHIGRETPPDETARRQMRFFGFWHSDPLTRRSYACLP
jgi:hypothetical protein